MDEEKAINLSQPQERLDTAHRIVQRRLDDIAKRSFSRLIQQIFSCYSLNVQGDPADDNTFEEFQRKRLEAMLELYDDLHRCNLYSPCELFYAATLLLFRMKIGTSSDGYPGDTELRGQCVEQYGILFGRHVTRPASAMHITSETQVITVIPETELSDAHAGDA